MSDTLAAAPARRIRRPALVALVLALLALAPAARAQTWNEVGDAGDLVGTAQTTLGAGPLATITGNLGSPTDVDMYCFQLPGPTPIASPLLFLQCVVIQGPNVFLFDAAGNGIATNETCSANNKLILSPNVPLPPGNYYVAVANYGIEPQSAGGPIWNVGLPGQRAPDGPGAGQPLVGWGGTPVVNPLNPYQLTLQYATYCGAPTPTLHSSWGTLKSHYR